MLRALFYGFLSWFSPFVNAGCTSLSHIWRRTDLIPDPGYNVHLFWYIVLQADMPVILENSGKHEKASLDIFAIRECIVECHSEINGLPLTFIVLGRGICFSVIESLVCKEN